MERTDLAARIDHTVLGPTTGIADVKRVLDEALSYGMNACVPPCYVGEAGGYAPAVPLVTVVGFPGGQHATAAKREEAVIAWEDGADELEVTLNHGRLAAGEDDAVVDDLEEVVAAVPIPVTATVDGTLLDDADLRRARALAGAADASLVKITAGSTVSLAAAGDANVEGEGAGPAGERCPLKAGGVDSWAAARRAFGAGAVRVGSANGGAVVEGFLDSGDQDPP